MGKFRQIRYLLKVWARYKQNFRTCRWSIGRSKTGAIFNNAFKNCNFFWQPFANAQWSTMHRKSIKNFFFRALKVTKGLLLEKILKYNFYQLENGLLNVHFGPLCMAAQFYYVSKMYLTKMSICIWWDRIHLEMFTTSSYFIDIHTYFCVSTCFVRN